MAKHKWIHDHRFISDELTYDQFKCRKCKIVKRNMYHKDAKMIKVLVQAGERLSSPVPVCSGYKFRT